MPSQILTARIVDNAFDRGECLGDHQEVEDLQGALYLAMSYLTEAQLAELEQHPRIAKILGGPGP